MKGISSNKTSREYCKHCFFSKGLKALNDLIETPCVAREIRTGQRLDTNQYSSRDSVFRGVAVSTSFSVSMSPCSKYHYILPRYFLNDLI